MRLNYSRRVFNNLRLIDTWSDNQRFVDGSLQLRYINSADPWIDKGLAMDLIKSFSYDDTHFELKLNQLDRMVYVWYQTRLTQPVEESEHWVDKEHLRFWHEVIDPTFPGEDLTVEVLMMLPDVHKVVLGQENAASGQNMWYRKFFCKNVES